MWLEVTRTDGELIRIVRGATRDESNTTFPKWFNASNSPQNKKLKARQPDGLEQVRSSDNVRCAGGDGRGGERAASQRGLVSLAWDCPLVYFMQVLGCGAYSAA